MAKRYIYYSNGTKRIEVKNLKLSSSFMDVDTLVIVVESAEPIGFAPGDYIDYGVPPVIPERRFVLRDNPEPKKVARGGSSGEAFKYEMTFKDAMWMLKNTMFTDVVKYDNEHHFTSLPEVSTYENVYGIKDRIQANVNMSYPGEWEIKVDAEIVAGMDLYDTVNEPKDFALSNGSCFDALAQIYEVWKVSYIHTVESGVNVITIGTPELKKESETTEFFSYKHGFLSLKYSIQNEDSIKTRITAYGNTTNMAPRHYNTRKYEASDGQEYSLIGDNMYIPNLMLPPQVWGTTVWYKWQNADSGDVRFTEKHFPSVDEYAFYQPNIGAKAALIDEVSGGIKVGGVVYAFVGDVTFPDIRKCYTEDDDAVAQYGVRPTAMYFNGYDDREDIHPSLKGMTIGQVRLGVGAGNEYYPSTTVYTDPNERVDVIRSASAIADDGDVENVDGYYKETVRVSESINTSKSIYYTRMMQESVGIFFNASISTSGKLYIESNQKIGGEYVIMLGNYTSPDTDYSNFKIRFYVRNEGTTIASGTVARNGSQCYIKSSDINGANVSIGALKIHIEVCILNSSVPNPFTLNYAVNDTVSYRVKNSVIQDWFEVNIKQIGFDLSKCIAAGQEAIISPLDGHCGGWEFGITNVTRNVSTDDWTLKCKRKTDDTLNLAYPNCNFPVKAGDHFVLLGINMPELYIKAKEAYLYESVKKEKPWAEEYVIEPEMDNLYMARYTKEIRTGMWMHIIGFDIPFDDIFTIDRMEVSDTDGSLPQYSFTLRGHKNGEGFTSASVVTRKANQIGVLDKRLTTDEYVSAGVAIKAGRRDFVLTT